MARIAIFTIGCKVNQAESEELKIDLAEAGHLVCGDPAGSDMCVVNTCTVTAESDRKCRKLIRWLRRHGAVAIVAAGCYAQVRPDELANLPGVVRVLPNSQKDGWAQAIIAMLPPGGEQGAVLGTSRTRGFIKVQDGCDRFCSYCIVPRARGRERSRQPREVLHAARRWLEKGAGELVLCGVNLGRYSAGPDFDVSRLVEELSALRNGFRLRMSSIEPEDLDLSWLDRWRDLGMVCPHLHLPLQSGDVGILKDMGRGYDPDYYLGAVEKLRDRWPQAALTTEVIVGYPGESERAFRRTVEVLEAVRPSRLHVFRFSAREGTAACKKEGQVPAGVMEERSAELRELGRKWLIGFAENRLGKECRLLVERVLKENGRKVALGTTEDYMKAVLESPPEGTSTGCLVAAKVYGIEDDRVVLRPCVNSPEREIYRRSAARSRDMK